MERRLGKTMAFALCADLVLAFPAPLRAQKIDDHKEAWIISNRSNAKFEDIYGEAQNVSLEGLCDHTGLTVHGAVRTRGILVAGPRPRPSGATQGQPKDAPSDPGAAPPRSPQGPTAAGTTVPLERRYTLTLPTDRPLPQNCGLRIRPGLVVEKAFEFEADSLNFKEIEVLGTFEAPVGSDRREGATPTLATGEFWFWAYSLGPAKPSRAGRTGLLAVEDLVARPEQLAGETVKVVGQFRGKNLFGDLEDTAVPDDGWVIKDGAFAVWVIGKKPKGSGWSLDPTRRGDSVRWVQVTGTLDRKGKVTRLKATEVALVPQPLAAAPDP